MARLNEDPITSSDIHDFCTNESDFAFELQTLELLNSLGLRCEHGGVYDDPVTQKSRQFDIRGLLEIGQINRIRLAIECKNIRANFPLVVFTVPRNSDESYHELISTHEPNRNEFYVPGLTTTKCKRIRQGAEASIYQLSDPVGKSCCQVGRDSSGELKGSDSEAYERWWQAIQSAHDLVDEAEGDWKHSRQLESNTLVLPALVIPDDHLWTVGYNSDGLLREGAARTDRASLFVNKFIPSSDRLAGIGLSISHLEILTHNGLRNLVQSFSDPVNRTDPFAGC